MTSESRPINLLNPESGAVEHTFPSVSDARKWTGLSAGTFYSRLGQEFHKQNPLKVKKGGYEGTYKLEYGENKARLTKVDDDTICVVTDGERVFHTGTLKECKVMKNQLRFPTLSIKPWNK